MSISWYGLSGPKTSLIYKVGHQVSFRILDTAWVDEIMSISFQVQTHQLITKVTYTKRSYMVRTTESTNNRRSVASSMSSIPSNSINQKLGFRETFWNFELAPFFFVGNTNFIKKIFLSKKKKIDLAAICFNSWIECFQIKWQWKIAQPPMTSLLCSY